MHNDAWDGEGKEGEGAGGGGRGGGHKGLDLKGIEKCTYTGHLRLCFKKVRKMRPEKLLKLF